MPGRTLPIPAVTEVAFGQMLAATLGEEPLSLTEEGHLLVSVRGEMMTRTDDLLVASEDLEIRPLNRRMQGRAVPEVFQRLAALEGRGFLLMSRRNERFVAVRLERDLCFFVEQYLWAVDVSLMWDVGLVPGSRGRRPVPLVRVAGEGVVALRVPGELATFKVAPGRAHRVHVDAFVGWVGNVIPSLVASQPFVHCEGEGAVFVALPKGDESARAGAERPAAERVP
jgi:hypothetical protein